MLKKIKKMYSTIFKIEESQLKILNLNHEIIWANIFHDSIKGEQDTTLALLDIFKQKNIKVFTGIYRGIKSQIIICTEKYKFAIFY